MQITEPRALRKIQSALKIKKCIHHHHLGEAKAICTLNKMDLIAQVMEDNKPIRRQWITPE